MREQLHSRRVMMSQEERDLFLREQRTCRIATVSADGRPHVTPLWFVWDGSAFWLYSITRSRRWAELEHDPRIAAVVDTGEGYGELRGVELTGTVEQAAEAPRTGLPYRGPHGLEVAEKLFAEKYGFGEAMVHD